jgi:SsrA-binding protein
MAGTIAQNRRARHEFHVEDTFEAGIVLRGTEIKSIRAHKVSLADAYARIEKDEAWIIGLHIAPYESTDVRFNHEPKRARKLLLHRSEIDELLGKTKAKGLTLVPLRIYINDQGKAKLELGLARGKQTWDRRREIAERDSRREMERAVSDARRR